MKSIPSLPSLHLRYRLWIAEMNFDLSILRIFDDALNEFQPLIKDETVLSKLQQFQQQFVEERKTIDELKHEMHLMKMKLAALTRGPLQEHDQDYKSDNHEALEVKFLTFKEGFDQLFAKFRQFELQLST
jgi:hypothetical protein